MNSRSPGILKLILFAVATVLISTTLANAQIYCQPSLGDPIRVTDTQGKTGYIDRKGSVVLNPGQLPERVVMASDFSEGLAAVGVNNLGYGADYFSGTTKYGFIDQTGKFVIKPQFDRVLSPFCDGLAFIENGSFQGYIDKSGIVVIDIRIDCYGRDLKEPLRSRCPPRTAGSYHFVGAESEGLTAMSDGKPGLESKYGFADERGWMVIKPRFEPERDHHGFFGYMTKFVEGRAKVKLAGLYGYIDKTGKQVITAKYKTAADFSEGLAFVVTKDGDSGFIDKRGRWAIRPTGWESGGNFKEGLAPVSAKSRSRPEPFWGYIDRRGRIVIKPRFDKAREFRYGVASVYEVSNHDGWWSSRFGVINKTGAYIWKPNSNFPPVRAKRRSSTR